MKNNTWFIVLVSVLVLVVVVLGLYFTGVLGNKNEYSVVYLTTGEVYVGKLTNLTGPVLRDAYIYQLTKDPTDPEKNNFTLNPINETLWAPQSLHINKDQIVFYGLLSPDSHIAKTLAEQGK
mgnify:CR=1 FL=1